MTSLLLYLMLSEVDLRSSLAAPATYSSDAQDIRCPEHRLKVDQTRHFLLEAR
jgi:hypothetical protein